MNSYELLNVSADADDRSIVVAAKALQEVLPYSAFIAAINEEEHYDVIIPAKLLTMYKDVVRIDREKYANLEGNEKKMAYAFECFIQQMERQSSTFVEHFDGFIDAYNRCLRNISANLNEIKDTLLDPEKRKIYDNELATKFADEIYENGLLNPDVIGDIILDNTIARINKFTLLPMIEQRYTRDSNSIGTIFLLARLYAIHGQVDKAIEMITLLLDKGDFTELIQHYGEFNFLSKRIEAIPVYSKIINDKREIMRVENERKERLEKEKHEAIETMEKLDSAKDELRGLDRFVVSEYNNILTKIGRVNTAFKRDDYEAVKSIAVDAMSNIEAVKEVATLRQQRLTEGLCLDCGTRLGLLAKIMKKRSCGKCK